MGSRPRLRAYRGDDWLSSRAERTDIAGEEDVRASNARNRSHHHWGSITYPDDDRLLDVFKRLDAIVARAQPTR